MHIDVEARPVDTRVTIVLMADREFGENSALDVVSTLSDVADEITDDVRSSHDVVDLRKGSFKESLVMLSNTLVLSG